MMNRIAFSAILIGAACLGEDARAQPPADTPPSANIRKPTSTDRPDLELLGRVERPLAIIVFEIGEAFRGSEGANIAFISAAHPMNLSSEPMAAAKQAGLAPEKFERIVATLGKDGLGVATFSDQETLAKFRKLIFPGGREETFGDRKLLVDGLAPAGYEPTDRTFALGPREAIERTLKPVADVPAWTVRQFQVLAREKPFLAVQVDAGQVGPLIKREIGEHGLAPLLEAQMWRLVCKKTAEGLHFTLSAHFDNATKAAASVEALRAVQNMLVAYFNVAAIQMPAMLREQAQAHPDGPKIAPMYESSLKRISLAFGTNPPQVSGGTLAVDCDVTTESPAADLLFLLNLMPRAAKEPAKP
jgi:hypothetical protein